MKIYYMATLKKKENMSEDVVFTGDSYTLKTG